jgi:hypothetical protein
MFQEDAANLMSILRHLESGGSYDFIYNGVSLQGFLPIIAGRLGFVGTQVAMNSHKLDYGTPICALTANPMEDDGSCLAAGMDDYVGKPGGIGSFGLIAGFGDARSLFLTLHAFVTRRPSMRLAPSSVR